MKIAGYEIHPAAALYPPPPPEEYEAIKADIAKNGQRHRVVLNRKQIVLDGCTRLRICEELGVEPKTETRDDEGSEIEYIISVNHRRRHLTPSQAALIALELVPMLEKEARQRMGSAIAPGRDLGTSTAKAAAASTAAGDLVSARTVQRAKRVLEANPSIADKIRSGEVTFKEAEEALTRSKTAARPISSDESDERYTTRAQFDLCLRIAGLKAVELDVAACDEAHVCDNYLTKADGGLDLEWESLWWCNPPWSDIRLWVKKALESTAPGLMLLPAWTDRAWWQELIEPARDTAHLVGGSNIWTRFLPRAPFGSPGNPTAKGVDQPHFWCVLVAFRLPMPWHARLSGERLPPVEPVQVQPAPPVKPTRPKKMFIDPNKETA